MLVKNLVLAFAGVVTAVTAWSIWSGDMFPKQAEPTGEPENWTEDEMKRWLNNVRSSLKKHAQILIRKQRNLMAGSTATREELLARVKANMRAPT